MCGLKSDTGSSPGSATPSQKLNADVVGFWTIYDEQSSEDAACREAAGEDPGSIFSSNMVLRADGQTSRGSDFPGGSWMVVNEEGSARRQLRLTLRNRACGQEWRYDGLLFWLEIPELPGEINPRDPAGSSKPREQLRAIGKADHWNVADAAAPKLLGQATFSMFKLDVDRSALTRTIQPLCRPTDPAEIRKQQKVQRKKDSLEAVNLRQLVNDIRELKRRGVEDWQAHMTRG